MYAVVRYNNYRKEQEFKIILISDDINYSKKIAFHNAKKMLSDSSYKLTTDIQEHYLIPSNKIIIEYMKVKVEEYKKNKFKIISTHSTVFSVIELPENKEIELLEEEDNNLICNNYYSDEEFSDEED